MHLHLLYHLSNFKDTYNLCSISSFIGNNTTILLFLSYYHFVRSHILFTIIYSDSISLFHLFFLSLSCVITLAHLFFILSHIIFFTYHLIRSFQFFVFRLMCVDPHFSWWEGMLESCITSVFVYAFRILWCFFRFIYRSLYSLKRADSTKRNKNEHREGTGVVLMVANIK